MAKERVSIEVREVMLAIVASMLIIMQPIRPSSAQDDQNASCLTRISTCLGDVSSPSDLVGCCPTIQDAIDNERDCFCLLSSTAQQNATVSSSFTTIFTLCGITDTFDTLCPASSDPSTTPESSPPSPTLPPTDETAPTPLPGSLECWSRVQDCTSDSNCCTVVKDVIANEKECFCAAKALLSQDPSSADHVSQMFKLCSIKGSFDTVCSDTPSSPGGNLIPSSFGKSNSSHNGNEGRSISSGSSRKMVGLLHTSLLIIWGML